MSKKTPKMFAIGADHLPGLAKLMEEASEVIQVGGKLIAREMSGKKKHWDGTDLSKRMHEELGDLMASIDYFINSNPEISATAVLDRRDEKFVKFMGWHDDERR